MGVPRGAETLVGQSGGVGDPPRARIGLTWSNLRNIEKKRNE